MDGRSYALLGSNMDAGIIHSFLGEGCLFQRKERSNQVDILEPSKS